MKNISKISIKLIAAVVGSFALSVFMPSIAYGINYLESGALAVRSSDQPLYLFGSTGIFTKISNTAMFMLGALCVLMLVFGGFRYVVSGGDAAKVTAAKNTILYAIIGVIIALLAYATIDFITNALVGGGSTIVAGTNV